MPWLGAGGAAELGRRLAPDDAGIGSSSPSRRVCFPADCAFRANVSYSLAAMPLYRTSRGRPSTARSVRARPA